MNKVLLSSAVAISFALVSATGCAAVKSDENAATAAIASAKAAQKHAASVGGEWRDTGKMIKKAEKLAAEGKTEKAIKTAKAAEFQGKAGLDQSKAQPGVAGPRF